MTKPERPPTVWGKLEWRGESGKSLLLRSNITQHYAEHAITDYETTYRGLYGRLVFIPHKVGNTE